MEQPRESRTFLRRSLHYIILFRPLHSIFSKIAFQVVPLVPILNVMIKLRLLTALCVGVLVYVFSAMLGGKDGVWAAGQLQEQKRLMSAHTAEIQRLNDELTIECDSLRHDDDVVAAYARKLGYVSDREFIVKISGLAQTQERLYDTGSVMRFQQVTFIPEWVCKATGLVAGILAAAVLLLNDYRRGEFSASGRKRGHAPRFSLA